MKDLAAFFWERRAEILALAGQHVGLVLASTLLAVAIGVPAGILLTRRPRLARPVLAFANVVQTIPSLALFGFLIPLPLLGGIGARTAIVALVVYALLPILRNTHAGIASLDPAVVDAATGLGMSPASACAGSSCRWRFRSSSRECASPWSSASGWPRSRRQSEPAGWAS